eukprot:CAMPEP_0172023740 /NCGR_PEP_ID=MMETSP1041-20130122/14946_1 /TAXON_ID=464988 /ORGANISM="Hemiselmis andersenii, Strain CCMP439" /LENGTH=61 /DNA_ID=CAMNT_0012679231 /DNA_START=135 /DNA_END=316 /DNA_ORIENTATION=-
MLRYTPLHYACIHGNLECVRELLELGGNVHEKGGVRGATPLHVAATNGRIECVRELLERGG